MIGKFDLPGKDSLIPGRTWLCQGCSLLSIFLCHLEAWMHNGKQCHKVKQTAKKEAGTELMTCIAWPSTSIF